MKQENLIDLGLVIMGILLVIFCIAKVEGATTCAPESITGPIPQVVRVNVQDRNGRSGGSGAFIGDKLIATARHVVQDRKNDASATIRFPNGEDIPGTIIGVDKRADIAVIRLERNPTGVTPLILAGRLTNGEKLSICGYGGRHQGFRQAWGVLSPSISVGRPWRCVNGATARSGDSGGPVINEVGEFAGILWGADKTGTSFTPTATVRPFAEEHGFVFDGHEVFPPQDPVDYILTED